MPLPRSVPSQLSTRRWNSRRPNYSLNNDASRRVWRIKVQQPNERLRRSDVHWSPDRRRCSNKSKHFENCTNATLKRSKLKQRLCSALNNRINSCSANTVCWVSKRICFIFRRRSLKLSTCTNRVSWKRSSASRKPWYRCARQLLLLASPDRRVPRHSKLPRVSPSSGSQPLYWRMACGKMVYSMVDLVGRTLRLEIPNSALCLVSTL
mmetsp:Transcript_9534/g.23880  ORF Transcript_9534/g.23880 Transcript_9534/m.23880 type:complete len:208 (-) Transcript_9534:1349-1972(-)